MDPVTIVIRFEVHQFALKVIRTPEQHLIKILAPDCSDQPLYEWVRCRHIGKGLEFLHAQHAQIRLPSVESKQRIVIRTQVLREPEVAR